MSRVIHDLQQGSEAWHAHRRVHDNASDAGAMLGVSPHISRTELVRVRALGVEREVTPQEQERFDDGHAYEAMARPWAEEIIGEDLYPITASLVVEGLPRALSASYDGATLGEDVVFEHKTLNQDLVASLERGEIPECYHPQMEQQLLILGATRCLFMASNGSRESMKFAWYESNPVLRSKLLAGWKQFHEDVKSYVHVEVVPKAVATLKAGLPTALIDVKGEVSLVSNLDKMDAALRLYVSSIPVKPATDEDFVNCEQAVKDLKTAEERLQAAETAALAHFESVEAMRKLVATMIDLARETRLRTDRLVKDRKEAIRAEILTKAKSDFAVHIEKLNTRMGRPFMPAVPCDFAAAMKGKKTVAGLQDAVNVTMATAKIAASEIADRIEMNLVHLLRTAGGYESLFADLQQLCLKPLDDFKLVVRSRVEDHKRAEDKRLADEREKIRLEEEAKARAKVEREAEEKARADAVALAGVAVKPDAPLFPRPESMKPAPSTGPTLAHYDVKLDVGPPRAPLGGHPPSDAEIVEVLADHYEVSEETVMGWLRAMAQRLAIAA